MIYGFFDPDQFGPRPAVRFHVRVEGPADVWEGFIRFLVDTGSEVTCIRGMDAMMHLRIPRVALLDASRWHGAERIHGYTGDAGYWKADARYTFSHQHPVWAPGDSRESLVLEKVLIGQLAGQRSGGPSILGCDVLERFDLFVSPRRGIVRLHDVREPPEIR